MNRRIVFVLMCAYACSSDCEYPVFFQISWVPPKTKIVLNLDDGDFSEEYEITDGFGMDTDRRLNLVKAYCAPNDSIKVSVHLNNLDTTFFINPKEINGCFLGEKRGGKMSVFYQYYEGGMREYSFE